jgi:UDP-N-acetyl-D-galactosamine dehydrogenase
MHEYGFNLVAEKGNDYDAIIVAVNHKEYTSYTEADFQAMCKPNALLVDLKGIYRNQIATMQYWSL